jgi:CDP-diacylglycerol--glycerol-3-phosphate 3-phosphatidyltransferase
MDLFQILTLPNLLSLSRICLIPAILALACLGYPRLVLLCFVLCLVLDFADGFFARRLNLASEFGAKLDTWADFGMFSTLAVCAWWLWPDVVRREAPFVLAALASYILPIVAGLWKFKRLTSYHTLVGKLSVVLMGSTPLLLFAGGPAWPLKAAIMILIAAELEEIAITVVLRQLRANVPSFWHALQVRQQVEQTKSAE